MSSARPSSGIVAPSMPFTILVIDDDALVLSTLAELLRAHGHLVIHAAKGRDGLDLTRAERPDLILLDHHMPDMDGLAVLDALKSDAVTRSIPVVVACTSGTAAEANRLVKAGCIGFIPKPFEPGTLAGLVAEFLRATVARDRRGPARPRSRPATAP
jgi:CheY-like chemotaxis protein